MHRSSLVPSLLILAFLLAFQPIEAAFAARSQQSQKKAPAARTQPAGKKDASLSTSAEQLQKGAAAYESGDFNSARLILKPLAEKGDDNAGFAMGLMAARGEGGQQNFKEAERWWTSSAASGNPLSQFNLGLLHYTGALGKKNFVKAREFWSAAVKQKQPDAFYGMGVLLVNGAEGVPKDVAAGVRNFEQAASFGHPMAELELGNAYRAGEGVKKDRKKAMDYYKKAAAKGLSEAQSALESMDAEK
ncbi:MAG: sel1 repeat family protein [Desulfovibrio sp.]|jgi:TPR repeat protein|nr:sel1 repeat family protein [Desulfovibrio sp.]